MVTVPIDSDLVLVAALMVSANALRYRCSDEKGAPSGVFYQLSSVIL